MSGRRPGGLRRAARARLRALVVAAPLAAAAGGLVAACERPPDPTEVRRELAERATRTAQRMQSALGSAPPAGAASVAGAEPIARWILPQPLREASGLALTSDDRLLVHGDEQGDVYEIDYRRGYITKAFTLGNPTASADFEGIAVAGGRLFLSTSDGRLFETAEGFDEERMPYRIHDTRLAGECEFEGLAFDARLGALILPCKTGRGDGYDDRLAFFRWPLPDARAPLDSAALPVRVRVPLAEINARVAGEPFRSLHPSAVEIDPRTGTYYVLAAQEHALVALTPDGGALAAWHLPSALQQPEGLTVTADGVLVIADEAGRVPATITLWPLPPLTSAPGAR